MPLLDIIAYSIMSIGAFAMFSGVVGLIRFPDFFTRIHATSVAESLGAPLVLTGLIIKSGISLYSGKIILLMIFMMLTGPTAIHILAKAATISGLKPKTNDSNNEKEE